MVRPVTDPLDTGEATLQERDFCRKLLEYGNSTKSRVRAYKEAFGTDVEYKHAVNSSYYVVKRPRVQAYMRKLDSQVEEAVVKTKVASLEQLQLFWSALMWAREYNPDNDQSEPIDIEIKDRLKASEYLARNFGAFIDKQQIDVNMTISALLKELNGSDTGIGGA